MARYVWSDIGTLTRRKTVYVQGQVLEYSDSEWAMEQPQVKKLLKRVEEPIEESMQEIEPVTSPPAPVEVAEAQVDGGAPESRRQKPFIRKRARR